MDKKSKEALRRYKKARQAHSSSESSSSSDSDSGSSSSYSSSASERRAGRHRHKKARQATGPTSARRSSSSSDIERRKREKREHCQKKLEAKRNHLKRKLKEAKLKKKAAAAAAALSGHSHRALSPSTQAKLKKLAERKHLRAASKERREREREKHRAAVREREHHRGTSRSPTKITKIRIHQDVKRQKSPPRVHHQLMSREKIIIQTRTRDRTPSVERERLRHEHKLRHEEMLRERERRDREAARDKERAEALARCQERQRERERLAREKLRREEEEKYGKASSSDRDRLLPRASERELAIANARGYSSRERSLERTKREMDPYDHAYMRKHREGDFIGQSEHERRTHLEREELTRERDYLTARRREMHADEYTGPGRIRDIYTDDDRDRSYKRPYLEDVRGHTLDREAWLTERDMREREMHDPREYRDMEPNHVYADERERIPREHERAFAGRGPEWKHDWGSPRERTEWTDEGPPAPGRGMGFVGGPKRGGSAAMAAKIVPNRDQRATSEPDWDIEEGQIETGKKPESGNIREAALPRDWVEHDTRDMAPIREKPSPVGRPWAPEWHEDEEVNYHRVPPPMLHHHPRGERGGRGGFRRAPTIIEHGERMPGMHPHGFRSHGHPAGGLLSLPLQGGPFHGGPMPRFPNKRSMTYTNPSILKKQQAALVAAKAAAQASAVAAATTAVAAAKAAAQSAANATTNPGILSQVSTLRPQSQQDEKPEAGEIVGENEQKEEVITIAEASIGEAKPTGELSEISDSDDDILNKSEKKPKLENEDTSSQERIINEHDTKSSDDKGDDEILDFEEISDGELEEESRIKGVGDALGVDWASLVAVTKRIPKDSHTTAKQRWQPHRILLDIGVSMRMAGEDYAKRLLKEAKQKLDEELEQQNLKLEIKEEPQLEENSQASLENEEINKDIKPFDNEELNKDSKLSLQDGKMELKPIVDIKDAQLNLDNLPPLACAQVAERKRQLERSNLIANACGPNSRALSARQDLKLRRQLCGLPARECDFSRNIPPTSDKLKAMALAAFQRALEVK
uniref:Uncharacterized protein n=1 Tax=Glossina morsitans morsitans TaxID=37546 RepID=A0A1B0FK88_GLOMM